MIDSFSINQHVLDILLDCQKYDILIPMLLQVIFGKFSADQLSFGDFVAHKGIYIFNFSIISCYYRREYIIITVSVTSDFLY